MDEENRFQEERGEPCGPRHHGPGPDDRRPRRPGPPPEARGISLALASLVAVNLSLLVVSSIQLGISIGKILGPED